MFLFPWEVGFGLGLSPAFLKEAVFRQKSFLISTFKPWCAWEVQEVLSFEN